MNAYIGCNYGDIDDGFLFFFFKISLFLRCGDKGGTYFVIKCTHW
ncbi:hypothetical protein JOJ88_004276 [Pantoea cypripedii]|nr:hypothetical protein [Pantoea cypripedii]